MCPTPNDCNLLLKFICLTQVLSTVKIWLSNKSPSFWWAYKNINNMAICWFFWFSIRTCWNHLAQHLWYHCFYVKIVFIKLCEVCKKLNEGSIFVNRWCSWIFISNFVIFHQSLCLVAHFPLYNELYFSHFWNSDSYTFSDTTPVTHSLLGGMAHSTFSDYIISVHFSSCWYNSVGLWFFAKKPTAYNL